MNWKIAYKKQSENNIKTETVSEIEAAGLISVSAKVPGTAKSDFENSKLGFEDNEPNEFIYYTSFSAYENDNIIFEGIDGDAVIFINGERCGESHDRNHAIVFENRLHDGTNEMVLSVKNGMGLWKDVIVKRRKKCEITSLKVNKALDSSYSSAKITVTAEISVRGDSTREFENLSFKFTARDEKKVFAAEGKPLGNMVTATVEIPAYPKLWFPKNGGKPGIYDCSLEIFDGNRLLTVKDFCIGLLEIGKDENGALIINGRKINITAIDWNTIDVKRERIAERLPYVLEAASEMGVNLIRLSGDEVFAGDDFYEYCETNGILVYNDYTGVNVSSEDFSRIELHSCVIPASLKLEFEKFEFFGMPSFESLKKFINPGEIHHIKALDGAVNPSWKRYAKNEDVYLSVNSGSNTERVIRESQYLQLELIKRAIEDTRLAGKIPVFNFTDGEPLISDSIVDYNGVKKPCFHIIRNLSQPFIVSINKKSEIIAANFYGYGENFTFTVTDVTGGGKLVSSGIAEIAANSEQTLGKIDLVSGHFYQISASLNSGKTIHNFYYNCDTNSLDYDILSQNLKKFIAPPTANTRDDSKKTIQSKARKNYGS